MTASTVYSTMASAVASPGTGANMLLPQVHGIYRHIVDAKTIATTSIDEVGDITIMCPIPSNAILTSLRIANTSKLDTNVSPTLAFKIGLYYLDCNGAGNTSGTELTTAFAILGTASTILSAVNTTPVELAWISRSLVADKDKRLWELGGLTADCGGFLGFGIKLTAVAATASAQDLQMMASYYLG